MDIIEIILGFVVLLGLLFGIPIPYIGIGKKMKKGYKWTIGIVGVLREKLFINDNVVEHFNFFVEEFENFVLSGYEPSFTKMYAETRDKARAKLSEMEYEHISNEIDKVERGYREIQAVKNLNRKRTFRQTVKKLNNLVVDVSKMAKSIIAVIKDQNLDLETLGANFSRNYNFETKEFNNYLRYFRSFLDRTHCYHDVEIEHYRLLDLLVPETIQVTKVVET